MCLFQYVRMCCRSDWQFGLGRGLGSGGGVVVCQATKSKVVFRNNGSVAGCVCVARLHGQN